MKRIISIILTIAMVLGVSMETFAAYSGDRSRTYKKENCTITYGITNEWNGNQQVSVSITNDGEETLRNWAVMFDNAGKIANIWNAEVCKNDGELCVIRNNGYNYEIIPNAAVEFGFTLQGENLSLPEDISLCSRTADSTESAEISYEIQNNWDGGFIASVSVKNISDKPLEAWKLSFNGNFDITAIWNANRLYTDDGSFKVENDITTTPILSGSEKIFSFQGVIASGETPVISDFKLTSVVIDTEHTQPEPPAETDEVPTGETNEATTDDEPSAEETSEPSTDDEPSTEETSEPSTGDEPDPATEETGETEEPSDPTEPEEHNILCFGEYLSEENSIKVYWYSTAEGAVSVHENTDGNGWRKLAEVTDSDSYEFAITEDFVIKYIKVSQQTANGVIESEPFIVAAGEDGYACIWPDSDNDGLPDYAEKIYGTDPENADTDGDGLSDYDEICKTGTNPLKFDTDEDGVNDAESDNDKDGLTNAEELSLGTDPNSADTDGDGLSDHDEINKYHTDPLKADSDGDTLNDGDEIAIGLDPNDPETFGVPDAEYKVKQTIPADSEVMENVNTEGTPYKLSLEITASGNAQNLIAGSSAYSAVTESDARLGGAVNLSYYGGEIEKIKLSYEIDDDNISNNGSEYAKKCLDLRGIKRYNIFRYFEEINMLLPVATEFDEENNTLFAETDELGTYCVLDMEVLLQNFGVAPDEVVTEAAEQQMYSVPQSSAKYCVTFVFDIRKGRINAGQLENLKAEVRDFAETVFAEKRSITIRLMTQDYTDFMSESIKTIGEYGDFDTLCKAMNKIKVSELDNLYGDYCLVTEAIADCIENADTSAKNYVFTLFDQVNSVFERDIAEDLGQRALENNVDISVITPSFETLFGFQKYICDVSGGIIIDTFSDFADDVYEHIFNTTYVKKNITPDPQSEFDAILATGYERITLDSILYPNGANPTGVDSDTDKDGLTDWDEVYNELLVLNENGHYSLPTVSDCKSLLKSVPFYVESAFANSRTISKYGSSEVLPIRSNPISADTDNDGYDDEQDLAPMTPFVNPIILLHGRTDNSYEAFGLHTDVCPDDKDRKNDIISFYDDNMDYSDVLTHIIKIKDINAQKLGYYLSRYDYSFNKNLFAFCYPNWDFAQNNAPKLAGYIHNLKRCVKGEIDIPDKFMAKKSDIFATKSDVLNNNARFILIAHSNGGLVARYYIENHCFDLSDSGDVVKCVKGNECVNCNTNGSANVDKLITIDTPHYGSSIADISTAVMQNGYTLGMAVPLDVELSPSSSLFTGQKLDPYSFGAIVGRAFCHASLGAITMIHGAITAKELEERLRYIQDNQSFKLNGNHNVDTQYYAIGGAIARYLGSPYADMVYNAEFTLNPSTLNELKDSILSAINNKYSSNKVIFKSDSDNVVDLCSQFGLKDDGNSIIERVKFEKATIFLAFKPFYNSYTALNSFHCDILKERQMQAVVLQYVRDK